MRSLRRLAVVLALICVAKVCRADDLNLNDRMGTVTLIEGNKLRIRCEGGPHPTLEIQSNIYDGLLPSRKQKWAFPPDEYKITLFGGPLTQEEAKAIFQAARDTVSHFQFGKPGVGVMDGTGALLKIDSADGNSIQLGFDFLASASDASPGIARIINIADSHAAKNWEWSKKIPAPLATSAPPRNRKAAALPAIFKKSIPDTIERVLAVLGRPDGFSKQMWYSKTQGSACTDNPGGTLLFLLDGGREIHVWTPDFKRVFLTIQYGPKGDDEEKVYYSR